MFIFKRSGVSTILFCLFHPNPYPSWCQVFNTSSRFISWRGQYALSSLILVLTGATFLIAARMVERSGIQVLSFGLLMDADWAAVESSSL